MYTLISSTLYSMDISRRSLKKHLHFKEEKAKKVKIQRQIYMSSVYLRGGELVLNGMLDVEIYRGGNRELISPERDRGLNYSYKRPHPRCGT